MNQDATKRGPGRPRKHPLPDPDAPKRPVGRPRKTPARAARRKKPIPALPLPSLEQRRREWQPYPFTGTPQEHARKVEVLAHLEAVFTDVEACRAAGVLRYEYEIWSHEDTVFANAVAKAIQCCVRRVETVMFLAATTLDEKGKVQTTAAFGILNSKTADWGLLKSQLYARQNAKLADELARVCRERLPADTADAIRAELDRVLDRSRRLPTGASLK